MGCVEKAFNFVSMSGPAVSMYNPVIAQECFQ